MRKLHAFHGGLVLPGHKAESTGGELRRAPLPERLLMPVRQHHGDYNQPLVQPGDRVLRGQVIAASAAPICAPVHAPTSGVVTDIGAYPVAHPSGQSDLCIVIEADGDDRAADPAPCAAAGAAPGELIRQIRAAGIVGLGGAVFPTAPKLLRGRAHGVRTLIVNGVECEPWITCDDMLMRSDPAAVISGCAWLQRILEPRETLIAIEDNKPEAIAAVGEALAAAGLPATEVVAVPTIYPSGGEKQLVQVLTGHEIPRGRLAADCGLLCQNVGTCAAIARALDDGQPLISRVVTCTGDNLRSPGNWEVRLGTPIDFLVGLAGGYRDPHRVNLVMGGPMMGFALPGGEVPIVKASNCIMAMGELPMPFAPGYHDECIRCGKCTEVCPAQLLPQQLYWQARAGAWEHCAQYHLADCIECGCCAAVCPSHIPLVQYYRAAKSELRAAEKARIKSDRARARFEFRERRLERKKREDEERRRQKREALQKKRAQGGAPTADAVEAALERVRAKKAAREERR